MVAWAVMTLALVWAGAATAATCTSKATGNWGTAGTWTCTAGTVPAAGDTVILASPFTVTLDAAYTAASLTINSGATLSDTGGRTLTVTGNIANNGTFTSTNSGRIASTGAAAVISGSGTFSGSARLYTSGAAVSIAAGSTLTFAGTATIRAGVNAAGTTVTTSVLTINGTLTSTQAAGTNMLRLYANSTIIGATGIINAANSTITYNTATATLTNNGSVSIRSVTQNASSNSWTQGNNSSLTVTAVSTVGTLNASNTGNTVTYTAPATPMIPSASTYYNLAGTGVTCPHYFIVLGADPCPPGGPVSLTANPGTCADNATVGALAWSPTPTTNVNTSDNVYATATATSAISTQLTHYLKCTSYGFAIPAGATINGIVVKLERKISNTASASGKDNDVKLVNAASAIVGTNHATATAYTTTDAIEAHGTSADTWTAGLTLADINSANFGAVYSGSITKTTTSTTRRITVDHMPITVTYTPAVAMHHIRIEHNGGACSGAGAPAQITLKACTDAACTAFYTAGNVTGINMAATGGGSTYTWSPANPQTITSAGGGINSGITLASSIAATAALSITGTPSPAPGNAYDCYNANSGVSGVAGSAACNLVFAADTFSYNVPDHTSGTQQVVTLTSCKGTFANKTRAVKFWSTYTNPATGTLQGNVVIGTGDPNCVTGYAALGTTQAGATTLNLAFGAGTTPQTTFSLCYPDVGNVKVDTRYDGTVANGDSGTVILGNDSFIAKPDHFTVSNIKRTSDNFANPAITPTSANPENDTKFLAAGDSTFAATRFTATVTAKNALNTTAPNYGLESPTAEGVKLTAVLVSPAGGSAGIVTCKNSAINCIVPGGAANFTSGVTTITDLAWSEVGILQLLPKVADAAYLVTGDVTTPTNSVNVGRFYPHHFDVTQAAFDNRADWCDQGLLVSDGVTACASPAFTYMGEPMNANFTLTAQNIGNTTTLNYTGAFAKLNPIATNGILAFAAVDGVGTATPTNLTTRLDTSLVAANGSGSFSGGTAVISVPIGIARCTAGTCPANVNPNLEDGSYATVGVGIAPVDSDGVTTVFDLDTNNDAINDCTQVDSSSTEVRFGRIQIANALGSELLSLPVALTAQYWDGAEYITNADDNETALVSGNILLGYQRKSGDTWTTTVALPIGTAAAGIWAATLSKPAPAGTLTGRGSVDMTLNAPAYSYLPGTRGRATFGVYKGADQFIYQRENY
jgi:MSHA biogenesis protein MshQ